MTKLLEMDDGDDTMLENLRQNVEGKVVPTAAGADGVARALATLKQLEADGYGEEPLTARATRQLRDLHGTLDAALEDARTIVFYT